MNDLDKYICSDISSSEDYIREMDSPRFFDKTGQASVNDRIIRVIISDFINLRIMTPGQLFRWIFYQLGGTDRERARQIAAEMIRHKLITLTDIELPTASDSRVRSGGTTSKTCVITLDWNSRRILRSHPDFRFARFGTPNETDLKCAFHNILITEGCLYFSQSYEILDIRCEDYLKSQMILDRKNNADGGISGSESVPDFQVFLEKTNKNGEIIFFDPLKCEVTVQSDKEQIGVKSKDCVFFTPDQRTSDLVKTITNSSVIVLDNPSNYSEYETIFRFLYEKVSRFDDKIWEQRTKEILKKTEKFGATTLLQKYILLIINDYGPLTAGAIAALSNKKRDKISRELQPLIEKEILHSAGIQFSPGTQSGRPNTVFCYRHTVLDDYNFRLKQLLLSLSIEYLAKENYKICDYLPLENTITAVKKDSFGSQIQRFMIDEPELSPLEFAEIFADSPLGIETKNNEICFIPCSAERLEAVRKFRPNIKALDIFV